MPPNDRARLERLCRYLLRSPLARDRVTLRPDGRVLLALKTTWREGTLHLLFEPIEFPEKLAALMPRPAGTLLLNWRRPRPAGALAHAGRPPGPPGP